MFKGCCFGGGGRALTDSPDLSDKRSLKKHGGLKDRVNGAAAAVGKGDGLEDEVVDSQLTSARNETAPTEQVAGGVEAEVNSSDKLPEDKEDSNGI